MKTIHYKPDFWQAVLKKLSHVCLLFLSIASSIVQAQSEFEEKQDPVPRFQLPTYTEQFDTFFRGKLDRIPFGILYNRVYPFAALDDSKPCDTLYAAYDIFQSWSEIERSAYAPMEGITYSEMRQQTDLLHLENKIAAIAVDVHMAAIDTQSFNDGRLIVTPDSLVVDGNYGSPYKTFRAQRVGLSKTELYTDIPYTIVFDEKFILRNNETKSDRLKIKLPNGVVVVLKHGESYTFRLTKLLTGKWTLTLESDDDPTDVCNTIIMNPIGPYHPQPIGNCTEGEKWIVESDIPFKGYLEEDYTTSLANAHIYYHLTPGNPCKIMKPIIILDGFDPQDKRAFDKIYSNNLSYIDNSIIKNLGNDLRQAGYDVIILNFPVLGDKEALNGRSDIKVFDAQGNFLKNVNRPGRDGGADYIERNAFLLVKLIQEINAKLKANGSHEKLVVVGPSMGGLISRYALAYMEARDDESKPNMKHNCRLWVSFDAPHQGANISAGTQYATEFFSESLKNVAQQELYHKSLRSVAARQMLVMSTPKIYGKSNFRSGMLKKRFKTALSSNGLLHSNGYPQQTRNISLLNGTLNGTTNFKPAQLDVFMEANKAGLKVFKFVTRTAPAKGQKAKIFEFAQRDVMRITKKVKLPAGLNSWELTLTNDNPNLYMDNDQGSYYEEDTKLSSKVIESLKKQDVHDIKIYYDNLDFTFIPSFSALDIDRNIYNNVNSNIQDKDLVCEGSTPFDAYFTPKKNQKHIYLDVDNVKWVLEEIKKGRPGCRNICPEIKTWNNTICNGSQSDFELTKLPKNVAYGIRWSADENLFSIVGSKTDAKTSVAAKRNGNQSKGFVRVTLTLHCAPNKVFEGEVSIPSTSAKINGEDFICQGKKETYEMKTETPAYNFHWYFGDAQGIYRSGSPYSDLPAPDNSKQAHNRKHFCEFGGERSGIYTLYAEAFNQCQEKVSASKMISIIPRRFCNQQKTGVVDEGVLHLYPNPTNNAWNVQLSPASELNLLQISLYDQTGRLVLQKKPEAAFAEIPAKELAKGNYVLQLQLSNGQIHHKKLIKN